VPIRQLLRRLSRKPSLKNVRQPFVGLVLALPEDDPARYPYLSFGIGCFHFGAHAERFDGNAAGHVEAIRQCLSASTLVSRVQIDDPGSGWFESLALPYGLHDGGQPFPAIRHLTINFRLTLSAADQNRIYPWDTADKEATIDVSIRQGPAVPVVFVVPRTDRETPTRAVTLTWHTLREITRGDDRIVFDMRAPSPLHMDCFLVPFPEPEDRPPHSRAFEYERVPLGIGHPYAVFAYDPRAFEGIEVAASALFAELEIPAGVFYEVEGASWRLRTQWEDLTNRRDELAGIAGTGFRSFLRRMFQGRVLRTVAVALAEFESSVDDAALNFREVRRRLGETPGTGFLHDEIDELRRSDFRFATQRVSSLLSLFETRRLSRSNNRMVVLAAVIAAALGALSAAWVTGSNNRPSVTVINQPGRTVTVTRQRTVTARVPAKRQPRRRGKTTRTTTP
jgi:hypothetical protein